MAYVGNIAHIPVGSLGLLTDLPPGDIPRGALIKANNISFETGAITKAPGARKYNAGQVLPASVVGLFDWWPNTATQRLIAACSNGSLYRDIGDMTFSGATAINTGLGTLTPCCMFVEGGQEVANNDKKLFFISGQSQVKVLSGDGTTFENIASPATDWSGSNFPTVGVIHQNRLWLFAGQQSYASDTADHENFLTNYLTDPIYTGEGGNVIGAHVFKGRLFCFKEGGFVYYLDDSDFDSSNWVWRKLASNFGLASPHGIVEVMNDMIAVNESGSPISYAGVNSLGDIESADLLRLLQIEDFYRHNSSLSGLENLHSLYYEAKKQLFFTGRTTYRTTNNLLLHIDYNKDQPRVALWNKDQAECLALRKDIFKVQRPIYGSNDGYVYLMDQEDRLTGSTAYTGQFKIGHTDFRWLDEKIASKNKLFDYLAIEFVPQGTWNLSVDVYIDGNFSETISFAMDVRDDGLDTFTLDTDLLGREEAQTIQMPLHGSGRRISFDCYQAGSNQNFHITCLTVGFRVSAEQATRV